MGLGRSGLGPRASGLGPIETWARGLAAAAVLGDGTDALASVGGDAGERAREIVAAWHAESREARARSIASAVAAIRAPVPSGADRVDRSHSEAVLAADDDRARSAWETRRADPVGVWWCRRVTAAWVELPVEDASSDEVVRWPASQIVAAMRRVTLALVAHVTLEGGDAAVARLAATLVDGATLVALARKLRADPALRASLGSVRAAAERVRAIDVRTDVRLGGATIARHLRGDAGVQLALLLPTGLLDDVEGLEVGWQTIRAML